MVHQGEKVSVQIPKLTLYIIHYYSVYSLLLSQNLLGASSNSLRDLAVHTNGQQTLTLSSKGLTLNKNIYTFYTWRTLIIFIAEIFDKQKLKVPYYPIDSAH